MNKKQWGAIGAAVVIVVLPHRVVSWTSAPIDGEGAGDPDDGDGTDEAEDARFDE